jgi:cell division protein FtsL
MISSKAKKKGNWILVWFLSFLILCCMALVFGKIQHLRELELKITKYMAKKQALEIKKKQLENELASSNEEPWIEKALIEELGVIPEGAVKLNYVEDE